MSKRFVFFYIAYIAAIVAIVMAIVSINKAKIKSLNKDTDSSIVRLVDHETGATFCSGTVISNNTIVTAGHCVVDLTPFGATIKKDVIDIRTDDNFDMNVHAKAVWATSQLDQGILKGDFSMFKSRGFITDIHGILNTRNTNTSFITCGYPMGGHLVCTKFIYKEFSGFAWRGDGVLIPGMSGGPAMTKDGVLVGVNVAVDGTDAIISPIWNLDQQFGGK